MRRRLRRSSRCAGAVERKGLCGWGGGQVQQVLGETAVCWLLWKALPASGGAPAASVLGCDKAAGCRAAGWRPGGSILRLLLGSNEPPLPACLSMLPACLPAADQQADGALPVCARRRSDPGVAALAVMTAQGQRCHHCRHCRFQRRFARHAASAPAGLPARHAAKVRHSSAPAPAPARPVLEEAILGSGPHNCCSAARQKVSPTKSATQTTD